MKKDKGIHLNQLMFGSSKLSDILTYVTTNHLVNLEIAKDGENYLQLYEDNALDTPNQIKTTKFADDSYKFLLESQHDHGNWNIFIKHLYMYLT